jgi:hypothetical protein
MPYLFQNQISERIVPSLDFLSIKLRRLFVALSYCHYHIPVSRSVKFAGFGDSFLGTMSLVISRWNYSKHTVGRKRKAIADESRESLLDSVALSSMQSPTRPSDSSSKRRPNNSFKYPPKTTSRILSLLHSLERTVQQQYYRRLLRSPIYDGSKSTVPPGHKTF